MNIVNIISACYLITVVITKICIDYYWNTVIVCIICIHNICINTHTLINIYVHMFSNYCYS